MQLPSPVTHGDGPLLHGNPRAAGDKPGAQDLVPPIRGDQRRRRIVFANGKPYVNQPVPSNQEGGLVMAANAYILVNADPALTDAVAEQLRTIAGAMVHDVLGPYDFVIDLEADSQEDIKAILRHKIRPLKGVTNTVTCICF
ncbi:MAG: Lrp/AsnC family transcriptional regulator [SAR202 cluster bacterium]|nr:Lrp/AsnC family transcriptional regulator [SAR202 cluster bacterium]